MTSITPDATEDNFTGDVEYLDLDGDGVPDAVRMTEVTVVHGPLEDVVQVHEEVDADIDVDGVPHTVETHDTVVGTGH